MEREVTYLMVLVQGDSKGSSVDPERTEESMEFQQSGSDSNDKKDSNTVAVPPPKR